MAQFSVNAYRVDPYKNFKFRVKWDGQYIAGLSKMGALKKTTEVVEHLERGVTHDLEFEKWANKVWDFNGGPGAESSLRDFRKDIILDIFNEAGQKAISYKIYRCWVSDYEAVPQLDANANAIAIQT